MVHKYGFIGAGNMSYAIVKGLIEKGTPASVFTVSSPRGTHFAKFQELGVATTTDNKEVVQRSTVLVFGVKPQTLETCLGGVCSRITPAHLVVSIVTGATTADLEATLGPMARVVRVVPNTPCAALEAATAICGGTNASEEDISHVQRLFSGVGLVRRVEERLMNAVTGLAGSGPAFVFLLIEALADGGVRAGLPRDVALSFAAQTVRGAGALVVASGKHPAQLKDEVCSPAGTTIAGVSALEKAGFRSAAIEAVTAAAGRATELAALAQQRKQQAAQQQGSAPAAARWAAPESPRHAAPAAAGALQAAGAAGGGASGAGPVSPSGDARPPQAAGDRPSNAPWSGQ